MKQKFQFTFAIWVIAGLVFIAGFLIVFSAISMRQISGDAINSTGKMIEGVSQRIDQIVLESAQQQLVETAKSQAHCIEAKINAGMNTARAFSQFLKGLKAKGASASGINRDRIILLMKGLIKDNPDFLAVYTGWEKDQFDGNAYAYENQEGHDATGRFIPYWFKDNLMGGVHLTCLKNYQNKNSLESAYYQIPKRTQKEQIIDPIEKVLYGNKYLITSLVSPIVVDNKFYGITGVDINLNNMQSMAQEISSNLFMGQSQVLFISNNGTIVADSNMKANVGRQMSDICKENWDLEAEYMYSTISILDEKNGNISVYYPLKIGHTTTPWLINIIIAESVVMKKADEIRADGKSEKEQIMQKIQADSEKAIQWQLTLGALLGCVVFFAILFAVFKEMNIRRKSEIAAVESEENLRITLDSIGDAVIATNTTGNITRMNPVAEQLTGWSFRDAEKKPMDEVFKVINDITREIIENPAIKVINSGEIFELNQRSLLLSKDGRELRIADSAAPIRDNNGNILGVILVFRDITKEYAMQEKLKQSQKMDAIGQLAGGIAHDFNNVLAGILGATELLKLNTNFNKDDIELLDMILMATKRASDLTSKLMTFSRKSESVFANTNINEVIDNTIDIVTHTIDKKIEIKIDNDAENTIVLGDGAALQNAFMNIIINASHAMSNGGKITLQTQNIMLEAEYAELSQFKLKPGEYIDIEIVDTGCGIPLDIVTKIFDPFFTTKPPGKGTGLGLATVYGIMQEHNGSVTVYSEEGRGTTFHLMIPCVSGVVQTTEIDEHARTGSGTILIVEDENDLRAIEQIMLKNMGYDVLVAEDGKEGVEIYLKHRDEIDLVITDMRMPEMNGYDLFLKLKEINKDCKVILASGFTQNDNIEELKDMGLAGNIKKPYQSSTLSQLIAEVLKTETT